MILNQESLLLKITPRGGPNWVKNFEICYDMSSAPVSWQVIGRSPTAQELSLLPHVNQSAIVGQFVFTISAIAGRSPDLSALVSNNKNPCGEASFCPTINEAVSDVFFIPTIRQSLNHAWFNGIYNVQDCMVSKVATIIPNFEGGYVNHDLLR